MNQLDIENNRNPEIHCAGSKRGAELVGEIERIMPHQKRQRSSMHVLWKEKAEVHLQQRDGDIFKDYQEKDIWYTKQEYDNFLFDRLRTVQCLRASGGDEKVLDPELYCIRGLESFQSADVHDELHSKLRFHQSTILIEQVRQSMFGRRDPERFLMMVGHQSEMSLSRAQELAALNEHEVYGRVCRPRSFLATKTCLKGSVLSKAASASSSISTNCEPLSLSSSERVRRLQESNARRLVEIYSQPGKNPFRFSIRRDSLVGRGVARPSR